MSEARRVTTIVAWVLLVWTVLLGLWAMQPLTDQVPTGKVDGVDTSVSVECARPIDAEPGPADPLPELEPPRKWVRAACLDQHSDNRWMLLGNVVLIAVIAIGSIIVRLRSGPSAPPPDPATLTVDPPPPPRPERGSWELYRTRPPTLAS